MSERVAGTLVDTCVLLDVITQDEKWFSRSAAALVAAADEGPLVINQIIYAEASVRYATIEEFDELLEDVDFVRAPFSWSAAFLAGKCHVEYRLRGGERTSPLPDFFIGAHAATMKLRLLTRDDARYRAYFPTVELIVP